MAYRLWKDPGWWLVASTDMTRLTIFAFCCAVAAAQQTAPNPNGAPGPAQTVTPAPAAPICPTWYAAGAAYSPSASPKTTGWAAVATLFPGQKCDPTKPQAYSYTQYTEAPAKLNGVWTLQQTVSTGLAIPLRPLGPVEIWALGTAGPAINGATSTVKLGSTYGAMATMPIFKGWGKLVLAFEWVNGAKTGMPGVTRSF